MKKLLLYTLISFSTILFSTAKVKVVSERFSSDERSQLSQRLHGNGMGFTPNKGQIIDLSGKLRPDILYKGSGAGADVYLRRTGISYVYSNINKLIREVDEQMEESGKKSPQIPLHIIKEKKQ